MFRQGLEDGRGGGFKGEGVGWSVNVNVIEGMFGILIRI